jgi:serine/threonine protein phosphatase PrpC
MVDLEIIEPYSKCEQMKRKYQEDSLRISKFEFGYDGSGKYTRTGWLLTVADGVGGLNAGDKASKMALNSLHIRVMGFSADININGIDDFKKVLEIAYSETNSLVFAEGENNSNKMGTTLVSAYIVGDDLFVGNVGDSRCYLIRRGDIIRATKDDSYVQELLDAGEITEEQAETHPQKNVITNAIGSAKSEAFRCAVNYIGKIQDYDYILLCSDGLHGVVKEREIISILQQYNLNPDIKHPAERLIQLAKQHGGSDNATFILAKIYGK